MTKVLKRVVLGGGILAGIAVLWGCVSTGSVESGKPDPSSGYSILGKETTVVDWDGRTLGAEATPEWLASANRGGFLSLHSDPQKHRAGQEGAQRVQALHRNGS